jgi:hypothetical protein
MKTFLAVLLVLALAGCTDDGEARPKPSTEASPEGARQADVRTLLDRLVATHPNPYHGVSPERMRAAADAVLARAEALTDDQFLVEIMRLTALLGAQGRDGHSGAWPYLNPTKVLRIPVRLWEFPDGLYITGGAHRDLVGARITAVDGTPVEQVLAALEPLVPRDNPTSVTAFRPMFFVCANVLNALGITRRRDAVTLSVTLPGGATATREVPALETKAFDAALEGWEWTLPARPAVASLSGFEAPYRVSYLEPQQTLYLQYNAVTPRGSTLVKALQDAAAARPVKRVIVDLRFNHGGDNTTYRDLVDHLASPQVDRPGALYVLAGRLTFSAAGNFAAAVAHRAQHERFVGEPTGGSPNQYGDHANIVLPRSGITVQSATTWVEAAPDDRLAIPPDLPVPLTAADYFADRDPVFQAAVTARA